MQAIGDTYYTRVTQKGQITIPKGLREKLGIEPNSIVVLQKNGDGGLRIKPKKDFVSLAGVFHQAGEKNKNKSIEQILKEEEKAVGKGFAHD